MKKFLAIALTAAMAMSLAACGSSSGTASASSAASSESAKAESSAASSSAELKEDSSADAADSDMAYVQNKGTLIIGVTDFAPMDYKDADGNWIGFDADLAKAFGEYLGVDVEFTEIDWDNKVLELNSDAIDCVWNGMTLTDEVTSSMECSMAYCNNQQVVVVPSAIADSCQDLDSIKDLTFAVEAGSAGEEMAAENGLNVNSVESQANALLEVAAGTSDGAIIDKLMCAAMIGEGTDYADLTYTIGLNDEEYGVGFRMGSDLAEALNAFFKQAYDDGTMKELGDTYGVTAALIEL